MENERLKRPKFVTLYLMNVLGSDIYKIGYTTNAMDNRKAGVKCEAGPVEVIGTSYCDLKHEGILHKNFKSKNVSDGIYRMHKEYFRLCDSDVSFVLNYFEKVSVPDLVMNSRHPKWNEFLRSISFWVDRASRTCDHTHFHTIESLRRYKQVNIEKSIEFFKQYGGSCDCAILKISTNIN